MALRLDVSDLNLLFYGGASHESEDYEGKELIENLSIFGLSIRLTLVISRTSKLFANSLSHGAFLSQRQKMTMDVCSKPLKMPSTLVTLSFPPLFPMVQVSRSLRDRRRVWTKPQRRQQCFLLAALSTASPAVQSKLECGRTQNYASDCGAVRVCFAVFNCGYAAHISTCTLHVLHAFERN